MPFVQAKCPECGGMLAVDDSKKAAVCQFCGEAFIVQEAINNYNTYNITNNTTSHNYGEGAVVNLYEGNSRDDFAKSGDTFIHLGDYSSAEKVFKELSEDCPYDYRGWWGLIRVYSTDLKNTDITGQQLCSIEKLYQNACSVASDDEKTLFQSKFETYRNTVNNSLDSLLNSTEKKIEALSEKMNKDREKIEQEINELTEKKKSLKAPSETLLIVIFVIIAILTVYTFAEEGFGWGILVLIILIVIGGGIGEFIGEFIDAPHNKKIREIDTEISSLERQLSKLTSDFNSEISKLNEVVQRTNRV